MRVDGVVTGCSSVDTGDNGTPGGQRQVCLTAFSGGSDAAQVGPSPLPSGGHRSGCTLCSLAPCQPPASHQAYSCPTRPGLLTCWTLQSPSFLSRSSLFFRASSSLVRSSAVPGARPWPSMVPPLFFRVLCFFWIFAPGQLGPPALRQKNLRPWSAYRSHVAPAGTHRRKTASLPGPRWQQALFYCVPPSTPPPPLLRCRHAHLLRALLARESPPPRDHEHSEIRGRLRSWDAST